MSEWIAFAEREPNSDQWIWLASPTGARDEPWWWDASGDWVIGDWTHWQPCPMPIGLPPKPRPALPDGWFWLTDTNTVRGIMCEVNRYREPNAVEVDLSMLADGSLIIDPNSTYVVISIPPDVIDALRKVSKNE